MSTVPYRKLQPTGGLSS